jgi:micrococcal nuclease
MRNKRKSPSLLLAGLVLILATSVLACRQPAPNPAVTVTATVTATSPPTSSLSIITSLNPPPISQPVLAPTSNETPFVEALVTRVIDGDTIEVSMSGKKYTVRYIGIDTPETVDPRTTIQPFGPEASAANKELVDGRVVKLEKDISETDKYGRLLRYVYVGELFINAELLRLGYAQVTTYPPDVKYVDLFLQLQREARDAGRGLWGSPTTTIPTSITPTTTTSPPPTQTTPFISLTLLIVSVTTPVSPGANATLTAQTVPGAECIITVYYKSGPSSASGLYPKTADSTGRVAWTWKVGSQTTPGSWRIVVKATSGGETVSQETYFTVR